MALWQYRWKLQPDPDRLFFGAEQPGAPLRKVHDALLAGLEVHAAVDVHHLRQGPLQGAAFFFKVVPDHKMVSRGSSYDAGSFSSTDLDAVPLFPCGIDQPHSGIMAQFQLTVRLKIGRAFSAGQLVVADVHGR